MSSKKMAHGGIAKELQKVQLFSLAEKYISDRHKSMKKMAKLLWYRLRELSKGGAVHGVVTIKAGS